MTLKQMADNGWIKPHKTSKKEVENLFAIIERDLKDAKTGQTSTDNRFTSSYNAALKLCTILLHSSGYRTSGARAHYYTIETLPLIMGEKYQKEVTYLQTCLNNRNHAEYDYVDVVSDDDVLELIQFAEEMLITVRKWLKTNHASLL